MSDRERAPEGSSELEQAEQEMLAACARWVALKEGVNPRECYARRSFDSIVVHHRPMPLAEYVVLEVTR